MMRGRPTGQMTPLRKRARAEIERRVKAGEPVLIAAVARRLGVDRRSARRAVQFLRGANYCPVT